MNFFGINKEELKKEGGDITAEEIYRQPKVWEKSYEVICKEKEELENYVKNILNIDNLRIIFTGAGTSGFIGDTVAPYIKNKIDKNSVESIHTTDIVSHPESYFKKDIPTLLISFARSGNSPESVATVELAENLVDELYQIVVTCNAEGKLAKKMKTDKDRMILLPEESNDKGFAMTSSYTSMVLSTLILFNIETLDDIKEEIDNLIRSGEKILDDTNKIEDIADVEFDKIIYLGANCFYGLAKEASLKLLELTQGKVVTRYDTPLGFRHGPKSIVDDNSLIVLFLSREDYPRQYDIDLLKELASEDRGYKVLVISENKDKAIEKLCDYQLSMGIEQSDIDQVFTAINYIIYPQILALLKSLKLGISPDNPSPDGSVNRVVKGVTIYPYNKLSLQI
ncbi:SIS domain-containing protein [Clostridium sp. D2Q-11]|uniref:SIS domain-containing protein n=1 Tax=Anaeromonas frigoriresistens TaxID=2683708 RepID=A0A942Z6Z2_9FIRM|nr:SIS domain-containing protein [Anaeromonas frigoriresistens]MBS4538117.1 SIS domain-containing protein [Anaeromonas frigoriresistens]